MAIIKTLLDKEGYRLTTQTGLPVIPYNSQPTPTGSATGTSTPTGGPTSTPGTDVNLAYLANIVGISATFWVIADSTVSIAVPGYDQNAMARDFWLWLQAQGMLIARTINGNLLGITETTTTPTSDDNVTALYRVEIQWGTPVRESIWDVEFVLSTETIHIISPKERIAAAAFSPYSVQAPQQVGATGNLIGIQEGAAQGADILSSIGSYTLRTSFPVLDSKMSTLNDIANMIWDNAAKTNSEALNGLSAGRLLLSGGSGITYEAVSNSFNFMLQFDVRSEEIVTVGTQQLIKAPHNLVHYQTASWETDEVLDDGSHPLTMDKTAVYIDRVYDEFDFNAIIDAIESLQVEQEIQAQAQAASIVGGNLFSPVWPGNPTGTPTTI